MYSNNKSIRNGNYLQLLIKYNLLRLNQKPNAEQRE
jgi:hypothetical protein